MLPVVLGVVAVSLAVTGSLMYCLPRVIPVKLTLQVGRSK